MKLKLLIQQISQNLKRSFNLYKRILVITSIVFFFVCNYHICNYYYPLNKEEHVRLWWVLKMDIYALIVALCFILASLERTTNIRINLIEKFITSLGIGLAISNVIDRHFKGTESYVQTDIMIVLSVVLVSFYDFQRLKKLAKTHNGNER